jgi:ArsR family transcriptional regulator
VYSLPADPCPELAANLACLQDCIFEGKIFRQDLARLKKIRQSQCGPKPI